MLSFQYIKETGCLQKKNRQAKSHLCQEFRSIHELRGPVGDPLGRLLLSKAVIAKVLVLNVVPSAHHKHVGLLLKEGHYLVESNGTA